MERRYSFKILILLLTNSIKKKKKNYGWRDGNLDCSAYLLSLSSY